MKTRKSIVVVEALSNGRFYIPEIEKRGYEPLVVLVPNENGEFPPTYEHFRKDTVATHYGHVACFFPQSIHEAYEQLAGKEIVAVVSGSDYGTQWTDLLAQHFGCPGNYDSNSALRYMKPAMQDALRAAGKRSIRGKTVSSLPEIIDFYQEAGSRKIVLKYIASAGSVGVHFCSSIEQIEEVYSVMRSGTDFFGRNNDEMLVQEYISGTEYIVNTVSRNGIHQITDIWVCDKEHIGAEGNAYNYYKLITKPGIRHARLVEYVYQTLDTLGFMYGPSHGEYFIDDKGPVLVEVGARPMGGGFSPLLYTEALGHHLVDAALESYLDQQAFNKRKQAGYAPRKEYMIKYLIAPDDQQVDTLPILPLLKLMPSVREGNFVHCIEDSHIVKTIDLITAPAYVQLVHADESVLQRDYQWIKRLESHHFHLLFSADEQPLKNTGRFAEELESWSFLSEQDEPTLVVHDPGMKPFASTNRQLVFASTDDLFGLKTQYNTIVLAFGTVENTETYFERIILSAKLLKANGVLYFSQTTATCIPHGEELLDIVIEITGLSVAIPQTNTRQMIAARKIE